MAARHRAASGKLHSGPKRCEAHRNRNIMSRCLASRCQPPLRAGKRQAHSLPARSLPCRWAGTSALGSQPAARTTTLERRAGCSGEGRGGGGDGWGDCRPGLASAPLGPHWANLGVAKDFQALRAVPGPCEGRQTHPGHRGLHEAGAQAGLHCCVVRSRLPEWSGTRAVRGATAARPSHAQNLLPPPHWKAHPHRFSPSAAPRPPFHS